jgi:hypothetical protein
MTGIAGWLPDAEVVTRHEAAVPMAPERALALVLSLPAAPDRLAWTLLRLRGIPTSRTLGELFPLLERAPTEVVFGFSGRPWRPTGAVGSFHEPEPGSVRIAAAFSAEPNAEGGTRVVTETRVAAVDEPARRAFARYWWVVAPFSGLVRRRWLAAVRREAARA